MSLEDNARRRGRWRPIGAAVGAALASSCARFFAVPGEHELTGLHGEAVSSVLDASSIDVVVWNVYKGKRRGWAEDFRAISEGRDLVLTQELMLCRRTTQLFAELDFEWTMATSFVYARREGQATGLATAARAPARGHEALRSRGREPITRTPKLALFTEHDLSDGSVLLVVNVHAINFAGYRAFDAQMGAVEARLRTHDGPLLLAGDFNTWSPRRRTRLQQLAQAQSLDPVDFAEDPRLRRLDHAFVRELDVRQSQIHRSRASDHMALSFELGR